MLGKTKYKKIWEENHTWLTGVKEDADSAKCTMCKSIFRIDGSGVSQVKIHESSKKHLSSQKSYAQQRTFQFGASGSMMMISGKQSTAATLVFTPTDAVSNAEILLALNVVDNDHSFCSASGDNSRFRKVFPNSEIAKSYQ